MRWEIHYTRFNGGVGCPDRPGYRLVTYEVSVYTSFKSPEEACAKLLELKQEYKNLEFALVLHDGPERKGSVIREYKVHEPYTT